MTAPGWNEYDEALEAIEDAVAKTARLPKSGNLVSAVALHDVAAGMLCAGRALIWDAYGQSHMARFRDSRWRR